MKYLLSLALFLFTLAGFITVAHAHDIGVTQTELRQLDQNHYVLKGAFGAGFADLHKPPVLPDHCRYDGNPAGIQSTTSRIWKFTCDTPLIAENEIRLPWIRDGAMVTAVWNDGTSTSHLFNRKAGEIIVPMADLLAGSGSAWDAFVRFFSLGVEHILTGIDHLLFVLALIIMVATPLRLLQTITGFTIAHSITLGLATFGFLSVPTRPVEAAIALSIVFICAEIIYASRGSKGLTYCFPWFVAFAFGLLHGLGFAGALSDIGLRPDEVPIALLSFNIGVEIGQLAFVAAVLLPVWGLRRFNLKLPEYSKLIVVKIIGIIAGYWFIGRAVSIFWQT